MEANIETTRVPSTPSLHISCRSPERGGVESIVLFIPLPNRTKFLSEAKTYLYLPFDLKIFVLKKCAQLLQKKMLQSALFFLKLLNLFSMLRISTVLPPDFVGKLRIAGRLLEAKLGRAELIS